MKGSTFLVKIFAFSAVLAFVYACKDAGMTCSTQVQCCSGNCSGGRCLDNQGQSCLNTGAECGNDWDCCSKNCVVSGGFPVTLRRCGSGFTHCSPSGRQCQRDDECCSNRCVEYLSEYGRPNSCQ